MDALVIALCRTQRELWFVHGCSGYRIHSTTNRLIWFGHGCSGYRPPSNTKSALLRTQTELWFQHKGFSDRMLDQPEIIYCASSQC